MTITNSSPDEIVESRIIESLSEGGILSDVSIQKLKARLAAGSLKSVDWQLIIELEVDEKNQSKDGATS